MTWPSQQSNAMLNWVLPCHGMQSTCIYLWVEHFKDIEHFKDMSVSSSNACNHIIWAQWAEYTLKQLMNESEITLSCVEIGITSLACFVILGPILKIWIDCCNTLTVSLSSWSTCSAGRSDSEAIRPVRVERTFRDLEMFDKPHELLSSLVLHSSRQEWLDAHILESEDRDHERWVFRDRPESSRGKVQLVHQIRPAGSRREI